MRLLPVFIALLPAAALGDSFTVNSAPTDVTVYASGAVITRALAVDLPVGAHDIVLPDLPTWVDPARLRVQITGATLGATSFRSDAVPPRPSMDSADVTAARERIKAAQRALRTLEDQVAGAGLDATAAIAKIAFLGQLGQNTGLPQDVETLRDLAQMIEAETLAARQVAQTAAVAARDLNDARPVLERDLKDAMAGLAALTVRPEASSQLTLSVVAEAAQTASVAVSYYFGGTEWSPVYDVYLTTDNTPEIALRRGAVVRQYSDENWEDVTLRLSTLQPTAQTAPSDIYPILLQLLDKRPPAPSPMMKGQAEADGFAAPVMEAPVIVEEATAQTSFDGPGVSYLVPGKVTVASGADSARMSLDMLTFDASSFARAVPRYDTTAFLIAGFTNTSQQPLLPTYNASLYVDNTLVGLDQFPAVAAGEDAELAFGPVEDLRLTRTVLAESQGDRGIISRSNARSETVRLDVRNVGTKAWQVELTDAVPYTIDEDLILQWKADPAPDTINADDQRGILQWTLDVPAGTTSSITVTQDLRWPEGKIVQ